MYIEVIDPVIKALREALFLAREFKRPDKQISSLQTVLRKLLVIRELHSTWFVSVAGVQGAGKTRLMQELYGGLDNWLDDNAGRGELRPLFIIEADCSEPYATGLTLEGDEVDIDRETLTNELRSFSDGMSYQLLRLYVPQQHFQPGFGFLLLPGYERENPSNHEWQREMRDALSHSMGSILVTDQTRMADSSMRKILADLMSQCFNGRSPIIAITRTEGKLDGEREQLRCSAGEVCRVSEQELDRIVCTGVGVDYRERWLPEFKTAIEGYIKSSNEVNHQRLGYLVTVVDSEIEEAVSMLEELVEQVDRKDRGQDYLLNKIMETFRKSTDKYRLRLERELVKHSNHYASLADKAARKQYVKDEEGIKNKFGNLVSMLSLNSSEVDQRFTDRIEGSWAKQDQRTPLDVTYLALSDIANRNLKLGYSLGRTPNNNELEEICGQGMPELLGYENTSGEVSLFKAGIDVGTLQNSLKLLLQENKDENLLDRQRAGSLEITTALELMPTLAMEFMRVAQATVLESEQGNLPEYKPEAIAPEKLVEQIGQGLSGMKQGTKEIMGAILAISAVDIGIDGNFDLLTVLAGGSITGLGAQLSIAAAGLIGLGYVGFKLSQEVYKHDCEQKSFIAYAIDHLASQHVQKVLQTYDEVMELLEERLLVNLQRAYGIDKDQLSERDGLARALTALNTKCRDLSRELDRAQCHLA